jgi:hypothetical protein
MHVFAYMFCFTNVTPYVAVLQIILLIFLRLAKSGYLLLSMLK